MAETQPTVNEVPVQEVGLLEIFPGYFVLFYKEVVGPDREPGERVVGVVLHFIYFYLY